MKTTDELLAEMRAALAHHEREAAKLRAMIAAADGKALTVQTPQPAPWPTIIPQIVPIPAPQPVTPYTPPGMPPWLTEPMRIGEVICGTIPVSAPALTYG